MKKNSQTAIASCLMLAIAAGTGYWFGKNHSDAPAMAANGDAPTKERKILYYRNPMGLPDISPVPKQDSMGMDYIAVREGDEDAQADGTGLIQISPEKVQQLGVRTEAAGVRMLGAQVRASARIEADERRMVSVAPKFDGYIEHLLVNSSGQPVQKGQPLLEAYSPELVSTQREYLLAAQGVKSLGIGNGSGTENSAPMQQLAEASLGRLRNWDLTEGQIQALVQSGVAQRTVALRAPASGIVTEKKATQGMRFQAGDVLYQIVDLSNVWVIADVPERDIAGLRTGAKAQVSVDAFPGKMFSGTIGYIYPSLNEQTRTVPLRIELANPGQQLRPGMFAQALLSADSRSKVLSVPNSAVIDSGTRQIVLVQRLPGRFTAREVVLGARSAQYQEILQGLQAGEEVVVEANFLIDSESNLKAALSGLDKPK